MVRTGAARGCYDGLRTADLLYSDTQKVLFTGRKLNWTIAVRNERFNTSRNGTYVKGVLCEKQDFESDLRTPSCKMSSNCILIRGEIVCSALLGVLRVFWG